MTPPTAPPMAIAGMGSADGIFVLKLVVDILVVISVFDSNCYYLE